MKLIHPAHKTGIENIAVYPGTKELPRAFSQHSVASASKTALLIFTRDRGSRYFTFTNSARAAFTFFSSSLQKTTPDSLLSW